MGYVAYAQGHCAPGHERPGEATQAEKSVKRRHDWPTDATLDLCGLGVHRDVEQPIAGAKETKRQRKQDNAWAHDGKGKRETECDAGGCGHHAAPRTAA